MTGSPAEQFSLDLSRRLSDQDARDTIEGALHENLLVEAGAGSGKTTQLVQRMLALVRHGVSVHEIAAVTFTRKAAGELRKRFQGQLECARIGASDQERNRFERALQNLDRAFVGTIHAFCARLLRERPLEAGVDPGFTEMTAAEATALASRFWPLHLERLATAGDPMLAEIDAIGLTPRQLRSLYEELNAYPDVEFPLDPAPPPDPVEVVSLRNDLEALLLQAEQRMPREEPRAGWDKMQVRVRTLLYHRSHSRWNDNRRFLEIVADFCTSWDLTQSRWADDTAGKLAAKELRDRFNALLVEPDSPGARVLDQWWGYRYPTAMRFAQVATSALKDHRRAHGRLDFQDLLDMAAHLLRTNRVARAELSKRWKYLLVDEFQDTDPLQAEVLFLLASDGAEHWMHAIPRPGALFVVGDPKQSIYRFRRADIALYAHVRERFATFGRVLTLTANFRSGQPVASLVNEVFAPPHGFPAEVQEVQACFASLDPQPRAEPPPREGVFQYIIPDESRARHVQEAWESDALAQFVADRVASGERGAGDFLILTRRKRPLASLARALEARGLPVQVSGVGIGSEQEVEELRLLLRVLTDPSDSARTVAVLTGLFFGLDHEQLLVHREAGRGFDLRRADSDVTGDLVEAALARMRRWYSLAQQESADVVVPRIADDLGLLAYAASGELGSIRAGALGFVLDAIRVSGSKGDTSLLGALEALDAALAEDEAEAPFEPGRRAVVRLMNLHKAKGLEGRVVVLAAPYERPIETVKRHVARSADGRARGWLVVEEKKGREIRTIARPSGWAEKAQRELAFLKAEELRLLYVAATRAGDELVVGQTARKADASSWGALAGWLTQHAEPLDINRSPAPVRERLDVDAEQITAMVATADEARERSRQAGYAFCTVVGLTKGAHTTSGEEDLLPALLPVSTGPGGYDWGSAVHGLLEAAARGASAERLRTFGRSLLLELDRPTRGGEPTELEVLLAAIETVHRSDVWKRAIAAERMLVEVPFALKIELKNRQTSAAVGGRPPTYLEGVVDLAFREPEGWVLVDYKTDRGTDPDFAARRLTYREQLRWYADAWEHLTNEPVHDRLILWTREGLEERVGP